MRPISPWIEKYTPLIPKGKPVLDVACGSGRHALYLLEKGYEVTTVDIDTSAIAEHQDRLKLTIVQADLEKGSWPFAPAAFSGIVVVNYLWRPLFPALRSALAPGGVLLYDTFAQGNEKYGRPRNPAHLLKPGELMEVFGRTLEVIDYFEGDIDYPMPACRQSVAIRKP